MIELNEATLVLDPAGELQLPDAIRRVCEASGVFLTIEVPGLGRALVIPENKLGDLILLFKSPGFASAMERGVSDFTSGRGAVRAPGVMPGDECAALQEPGIADSFERGVHDFNASRGTIRRAGEYPC